MRLVGLQVAAALLALLALVGCSELVVNTMSPQEARQQVVDVSRQVVSDLGGDLVEAKFGYSSCNDQNEAPFRGHSRLKLWMPGADRSREVASTSVLDRLRQRGWQSNPDFRSHGTTFKRDNVDVSVRVIPPPKEGKAPTSHVLIDLYGECRDAFDHRTDKTDRLFEDIRNDLATG